MSDQSNKNTPDYESEIKNREEKIKSLEKYEIPTKSYSDNISLIKERTKENILNFIKYYLEIFIKLVKYKEITLITKKKVRSSVNYKSTKKISNMTISDYENEVKKYKSEIEDQLKFIDDFEIDTSLYTTPEIINNTEDDNIKQSIINTIESAINDKLFTLNAQTDASSSGLEEIKESLSEKRKELSKEREKTPRWIWEPGSNKEEKKWPISSKILFFILIIGILISCYSELRLSYSMLTTNINSFADTPSHAYLVGLAIILCSFSVEGFMYGDGKVSLNKKLTLICIFIFYILLHLVIYDLQTTGSSANESAEISLSNLSGEADNAFNSENLFYSIISILISIVIILFSKFALNIYDKNRINKHENDDWINLNNSIEDIDLIFPEVISSISLLPDIQKNITNKRERFCSIAKLKVNAIIGQYERNEINEIKTQKEKQEVIKIRLNKLKNLEESLKKANTTLDNKKLNTPENKDVEEAKINRDKIQRAIYDAEQELSNTTNN